MPQGKYQIPTQKETGKFKIPQTATEARNQLLPGNVSIGKTIGANLPSDKTLASITAGAAGTFATGSPLIGSAVIAGVEQLFQPKPTAGENIGDIIIGTGINEIGGRLLNALPMGVKALKAAAGEKTEMAAGRTLIKGVTPDFLKLKPTAAQIEQSHILHVIENVFGEHSKISAMIKSGELTHEEANNLIGTLTGRSDITLAQPFKQATNIEKGLESQFDLSKFESNKRGAAAAFIAKGNRLNLIDGTVVEGPILPTRFLTEAKNLLKTLNSSDIPPDPNGPLVKALENIINKNEMAGGVRPRSFGDMWQTKQVIDDIAYESKYTKADFVDARFKKLASALNKDIDASMPLWQTDGKTAQQFWNEAKQIVGKRLEIFEKTKPIEKLLNDEVVSLPPIDAIIANPAELRKTLIAGKLQIPEQGKFKYLTSNVRRDLQGYEISNLFNKARIVDEAGNVSYNGKTLLKEFSDPNKQESYKMLFNQQNRADIEQFFKNISKVNEKGLMGPTTFTLLRIGSAGVTLGAGIVSGIVSDSLPIGSMVSGGGIVGGTIAFNKLSKLLTDPSTARLMVAAAQGSALGMPSKFAGRAIANVLKNTPFIVEYEDGNKVEGKIDSQGKFGISTK